MLHTIASSRHRCGAALALALAAWSGGTAAAPLCTFSTPTPSACVINFDASALGVGPFDGWSGTTVSGRGFSTAVFEWSWYDGLDATGERVASNSGVDIFAAFSTKPPLLDSIWDDGRASILILHPGQTDDLYISLVQIRLVDSNARLFDVAGTRGEVTAVPTPATPALVLAAGVAAWLAMRRRPATGQPRPAAA
jgi:hypothetical protein